MASVDDIPDRDLLARIIRKIALSPHKRKDYRKQLWIRIMDITALGSTYSIQLCHRYGFDPDELV